MPKPILLYWHIIGFIIPYNFQATIMVTPCSPLRLMPARALPFLCLAKEKEAKEKRLRAQVWPRQTSLTPRVFSGAKRNWISCNLRLRRFEHTSPYSPKNRAPLGCASRQMARPVDCWWKYGLIHDKHKGYLKTGNKPGCMASMPDLRLPYFQVAFSRWVSAKYQACKCLPRHHLGSIPPSRPINSDTAYTPPRHKIIAGPEGISTW